MSLSKKRKIELVTTGSVGISPSALSGTVYWYDRGTTLNGESILYSMDDAYVRWHNGGQFVFTATADLDSAYTDAFLEKVTQFTVTGAGIPKTNGTYDIDAPLATDYTNENNHLCIKAGSNWKLQDNVSGDTNYDTTGNVINPPLTVWALVSGSLPIPTLAYTAFDDGTLIASGSFSGSMTFSEYTLADAWYRAETIAFDSLRDFTTYTENKDCFRGFLPYQGDTDILEMANVWMFTSGGSSEFDIDRLAADNALWCSLRVDAEIESVWTNRSDAMKWAGVVQAWLKQNDNLRETGNIEQVRLLSIPEMPEEYIVGSEQRRRFWRQSISLEIIYRTESVF